MSRLPDYEQQIVQAHAALIVQAVKGVQEPTQRPQLDSLLQLAANNGWGALVAAIRRIVAGERDAVLQTGELDDEDRSILRAILRGLQDPSTLPDPDARPDGSMAAPGLAHMIHQARSGNVEALSVLGGMAEQMTQAGGDMARLGGLMRRLVDGERDPDRLRAGLGPQGEQLLLSLLEELARLEPQ